MVRCVCASMKPGRRVASPRSIVSAPAGIVALPPTPAIFPSVTTSKPGVERVLLLPSNIRAAFSTYVLLVFGVCAMADKIGKARKPTSSQLHHLRMSFSYWELLDSVSVSPGTHDNSLLTVKVKDCVACFAGPNALRYSAWVSLRFRNLALVIACWPKRTEAFFTVFHTVPQGGPSVLLTPLLPDPETGYVWPVILLS